MFSQDARDRAIVAERQLRLVSILLATANEATAKANEATAAFCATNERLMAESRRLNSSNPPLLPLIDTLLPPPLLPPIDPVLPPIDMSLPSSSRVVVRSEACLFDVLLTRLRSSKPSKFMQNFAARVLAKNTKPGKNSGILRRVGGKAIEYNIVPEQRAIKSTRQPRARLAWIKKQVERVMTTIMSTPNWEDNMIVILKIIAKKSGFFVATKSEIAMTPEQSVAMRDHMKCPTNIIYRLKQALEAFSPVLKNALLPSNIRKHISSTEKECVIPSKVVDVDCSITKAGNKRGTCTFYFCERPGNLLEAMIRRMYLDNAYESSQSFSALIEMLVVTVGFDKSDADFIGTWRVCNRRKGNSALFVQSFACLEGPVAENYENEIKTIGNPEFPVKKMMQHLADDSLYTLVLSTSSSERVDKCSCFVFMPTPVFLPGTTRVLTVHLTIVTITESMVQWNSNNDDAIDTNMTEGNPDTLDETVAGLPPTVPVCFVEDSVDLVLVTSNEDQSIIVGLQFLLDGTVVASWRLDVKFKLGTTSVEDIVAKCHQLSGHVSNDNKQINILTGQGTCSVGFPMACCMVSKHNLGCPPEWIQRMTLRVAIQVACAEVANNLDPLVYRHRFAAAIEAASVTLDLPEYTNLLSDHVIELIGEFAGLPVSCDPPWREGELSFKKTHAMWARCSRSGRHKMTQEAHKRDNAKCGSSFYPSIYEVASKKQNGGVMHTPNGHINHYWVYVSNAIKAYMKDCLWQQRLSLISSLVVVKRKENMDKISACESTTDTKEIKRRLRAVRRQVKKAVDELEIEMLSIEEEAIIEELRVLATVSKLGDYNLVHAGLKDFEDVLKLMPTKKGKKDSKRPESDVQYVLWKTIESRAGGCLDLKMSGLDQTNKAGLTSLKNCRKVFEALLGMYPAEHEIHQWLKQKIVKWEPLANSIFDVGCFVKSQQKRSPIICDIKLFRLWCGWEDAFPGKKFNKFHGLFCTIRRFVHTYHMAGRVSEESGEAYNGTLKVIKGHLKSMPLKEQRIATTTAREQGNIKGSILEARLQIQEFIKGKERGSQRPKARTIEKAIYCGR